MRPRPSWAPWWLPSQRLDLSPSDVWCVTLSDATPQHRVVGGYSGKTDQSPVSSVSSPWQPSHHSPVESGSIRAVSSCGPRVATPPATSWSWWNLRTSSPTLSISRRGRGVQREAKAEGMYVYLSICCQLSRHIIKLVSETLSICNNHYYIFFSKKWKKLLTFPHISECIDLVSSLRADNYDYIVGEQPIGNKLFRQFCQSNKKHYTHYNDFLDDVDNYETVLEENRTHEAQKIFTEYLSKPLGKFSFKDIKPRCASKNRWTYI